MLRTLYDEDRGAIADQAHIEIVWDTIAANFKKYFERLVTSSQSPTSPLAVTATLSAKFRVKAVKQDLGIALGEYWLSAIKEYNKRADVYRSFFNLDTLEEYFELDANQFKRDLWKKQNCPIVHDCVMSQREVMHDWQRKFKGYDRMNVVLYDGVAAGESMLCF